MGLQSNQRKFRNQKGFTLIEIMVVVVILGILATFIVPRLLDRPDEARRTKAILDIRALEESLGLFKLDNGYFPATEQGLQALVVKPSTGRIPSKYPEGGYLKKIPLDPWDGAYIYLSPGVHDSFDIISLGADGEAGGEGKDADINSWEIE
jgi:general secretion pathway protein G